ncbi:hypothetical protein B9Z51_14555 [Limnohabitans sp. T6-5]|uniref:hypothetical protein n=1 Tax=Limnohabitans sp. T6-5 TaxID=1100724 RepID=UPI000D3AC083|nr:hypothetical protein [Limnohabitans sp. T6-5]PUE07096.1 hypothetical protein B9Z51_14555 [Limnohabitans sp. T6-5]
MRAAAPEASMRAKFNAYVLLWLMPLLTAVPLQAAENPEIICEYRTIEVNAQTGDIRFIAPLKTGPEDCSDRGAALAELDPAWRQKLPPRVRWKQQQDALNTCEQVQTPLGERVQILPDQGCVFLQKSLVCTIVTAQAVSHAQLANAVRGCVP